MDSLITHTEYQAPKSLDRVTDEDIAHYKNLQARSSVDSRVRPATRWQTRAATATTTWWRTTSTTARSRRRQGPPTSSAPATPSSRRSIPRRRVRRRSREAQGRLSANLLYTDNNPGSTAGLCTADEYWYFVAGVDSTGNETPLDDAYAIRHARQRPIPAAARKSPKAESCGSRRRRTAHQ